MPGANEKWSSRAAEHPGTKHAAGEVADACGAETENRQDDPKMAVQEFQSLEVRRRLPDLRRPCRLREFLEQSETVTVLALRSGEQAVQQSADVIGLTGIHEGNEIRLARLQPRTDQFDQDPDLGTWKRR